MTKHQDARFAACLARIEVSLTDLTWTAGASLALSLAILFEVFH